MACVVSGTLAMGWSRDLTELLRSLGCNAVCPDVLDPFSLVLHRAKARNAHVVYVSNRMDVSFGPDVDTLVTDLSRALGLCVRHRVELVADPAEFACRSFADHGRIARDSLGGNRLKKLCAPAYVVDTPALFEKFIRDGLSRRSRPVGTHMERPDWIWEDEDGRCNVWGQENHGANPCVQGPDV